MGGDEESRCKEVEGGAESNDGARVEEVEDTPSPIAFPTRLLPARLLSSSSRYPIPVLPGEVEHGEEAEDGGDEGDDGDVEGEEGRGLLAVSAAL